MLGCSSLTAQTSTSVQCTTPFSVGLSKHDRNKEVCLVEVCEQINSVRNQLLSRLKQFNWATCAKYYPGSNVVANKFIKYILLQKLCINLGYSCTVHAKRMMKFIWFAVLPFNCLGIFFFKEDVAGNVEKSLTSPH